MKRGLKSSKSEAPESRNRVVFLGRDNKPPSPPQTRSLGECCKLAQWGVGRSSGKMWFWCISGLEKSSNPDISQLDGHFHLLELCKINSFYNRWGVCRPIQHLLNNDPVRDFECIS